MTMRLTPKQLAYVDFVARDSFEARVQLNYQMPEMFPFHDAKAHLQEYGPVDWNEHFKRDDISGENRTVLDTAFFTAYQREHENYMRMLYTPQTLAEFEAEKEDEEALESFLNYLAKDM